MFRRCAIMSFYQTTNTTSCRIVSKSTYLSLQWTNTLFISLRCNVRRSFLMWRNMHTTCSSFTLIWRIAGQVLSGKKERRLFAHVWLFAHLWLFATLWLFVPLRLFAPLWLFAIIILSIAADDVIQSDINHVICIFFRHWHKDRVRLLKL